MNRVEKPRTLLAFQPRALKSKAAAGGPKGIPAKGVSGDGVPVKSEENGGGGASRKGDGQKKGMSNAMFRDMLFVNKSTDDSVK